MVTGQQQLPGLVQEVTDGERQELLAFGDRLVGDLVAADGGQLVLRILGEPVVAQVPHHGVVMAEHTEVMRDALQSTSQVSALTPLAANARRGPRGTSAR